MDNSEEAPSSSEQNEDDSQKCCKLIFKKTDDATGVGMMSFANGPVIMSNIFLATAFITLGEKEIGCYSEEDEPEIKCGKVYGFKPSSLITNISVISGLLVAFFIPIIGACVDCTSYRRILGIITTIILITIQATQIATFQSTWFVMVILQAINGFIYRAKEVSHFSYYPEIARDVGEKTMTRYSADYTSFQFSGQVVFLLTVIMISTLMDFGDVRTAQIGQAVSVLFSGVAYGFGWNYVGNKPAARTIPEGKSIFSAGFVQVIQTCRGIWKHYRSSLGWFFIAVIFAQCCINAFTTVSVTFIRENLDMSGTEIAIVFLIVLVSCVPGSYIGVTIANKTNPKTSMKINLILLIVANFVGFLLMTDPGRKLVAYVFGFIWGLLIGWFYSVEVAIFSMLTPPDQESELTGFYLYCNQILSFFPPMVFTIMNESDISLGWAGVHLNIYLFISLLVYHFMMGDWETCLENSKVNLMKEDVKNNENVDDFENDA